jgi:hypothetical protein
VRIVSEAKLEKPPKEIMDYLETAIFTGWYRFAKMVGGSMWDNAYWEVTGIDRSINHYKSYNDPNLIDYLSRLSGIDYKTYKEMWSKLSEEQRAKVINTTIHDIAVFGVSELFNWIAEKLSRKKYKEARAKVLQAAKDYLNGKIDETTLMNVIADVFWPSWKYTEIYCKDLLNMCEEEDICYPEEEEKCDERESFRLATTLVTKYLSSDDVGTLVEMDLVHRLEKLE